jgi:hypothetical protein
MSYNAPPPSHIVTTQYAQPTTGQTVTANPGVNTLFLDPAGTLATLTVVLPASPVEGQLFRVAAAQIITALTITGTIVGTLTTLALGGFAQFVYSATASKWFRTG